MREIELTPIYKQIASFCKSRLGVEYPLTQEAAGKCFAGVSAEEAIEQVRELAAKVITANVLGTNHPTGSALAPERVLEITLEAERLLATRQGIECDLPGHPDKKVDLDKVCVPKSDGE